MVLEAQLHELGAIEQAQALAFFLAALLLGRRMSWSAAGAVAGIQATLLLALAFRELDLRESGLPDLLIWLSGDAGSTTIVGPAALYTIANSLAHRTGFREEWRRVPWRAVALAIALAIPFYILSDFFEDGQFNMPSYNLFFEESAESIIAMLGLAYAWAASDVKSESIDSD